MPTYSSLKHNIAKKIYRFLQYWAVDYDNTPERRIADYRAKGMKIGQNTVIYDCDLDGLYPMLLEIGSGCILTHCTVLCHDDAAIVQLQRRRVAPVKIGNNCFIGHGCLIQAGVTIGDDCIVAARSVVKSDVPSGFIVSGFPAIIVGTTAEYRESHANSPELLDVPLTSVVFSSLEDQLLRATLARHRPDLL